MDTKPGVVVVTKFCRPGSDAYQSYVDYIDRENAKIKNGTKSWNLYQDYMGNPEKSTGLFTRHQDALTKQDKRGLKKLFETAQENGSLMWQTVISFDNNWLAENGLYSPEDHRLDEKRIKEITRNAVEKMLKKEGLENAIWSAAIHYNTDNIHIHVATAEPVPQRRKKEFPVYKSGKSREPLLDQAGRPVTHLEYVGRFQYKSIAACKSTVVNEILRTREVNYQINHMIRENIVAGKKDLHRDPQLRDLFLELYKNMPDCDRKLWNYNNPIMADKRELIDRLSSQFMRRYREDELNSLKQVIARQSEAYQRAYGRTDRKYMDNKINDLYTRMGNVILKEVREYDRMNRSAPPEEKGSGRRTASRGSLLFVMRQMNNSMKNTYEDYLNERIHEALLQGRSIDEIDLPGRE